MSEPMEIGTQGPSSSKDDRQLQIKLKTVHDELAVPDTTLSVPFNSDPAKLNNLVRSLLKDSVADDSGAAPEFDFFVLEDLLRGSLGDFIADREDISPENVLEVLYLKKQAPPKPKDSHNHDDWVAGVDVLDGLILSACYDHTVSLWDAEKGQRLIQIPGHTKPVRSVAFVNKSDDGNLVFASGSNDQTVILYSYNPASNSVECMNVGKGHERSVESIAVDPTKTYLASGSFDASLKIWGTSLSEMEEDSNEPEGDGESENKKAKLNSKKKPPTRTPLLTLAGHKECVSGVTWLGSATEVATASWDHTLRIWDAETSSLKTELVGNKAFFGIAYSPVKKMLLTAASERTIRLYDPRSTDGLLVKSAYASHTGWITCVDWCRDSEFHFVSGSHDTLLKMWDARSCKTPLYDLKGHTEQVLCCSWTDEKIIVSGGSDNDMKIFKSNHKQ